MINDSKEKTIINSYLKKGIDFSTDLQNECEFSQKCYKKNESKKRLDDRSLYLPYIGDKYELGKILVLGMNMNNNAGKLAAISQVNTARNDIKLGKIASFKTKSVFYHRMACFVASLLSLKKLQSFEWNQHKYPPTKILFDSFDYIAYTNTVKCSPEVKNGKPLNQMWKYCPNHILKNEISVLKPEIIITLGKNKNGHSTTNALLSISNKKETIKSNGNFTHYKIDLGYSLDIDLYAMFHPSMGKGMAEKLPLAFSSFINLTTTSI